MRLRRLSAATVPWTRFQREMPERRSRVTQKCVCGSPDAVGGEDDMGACCVAERRGGQLRCGGKLRFRCELNTVALCGES
jgi:hypothetical protein